MKAHAVRRQTKRTARAKGEDSLLRAYSAQLCVNDLNVLLESLPASSLLLICSLWQWFFSDAARAEREERRKQLEKDGLLEYTTLSPGAPVTLHGLTGVCVKMRTCTLARARSGAGLLVRTISQHGASAWARDLRATVTGHLTHPPVHATVQVQRI
jgi:hypothetical protein